VRMRYKGPMPTTTERAIAALELLPEEMREPAVAYLLEQAEKFLALKAMIQEGIDDVEAGRVGPLDMQEIFEMARKMTAPEIEDGNPPPS
jgi:predicted transcriptional regulator